MNDHTRRTGKSALYTNAGDAPDAGPSTDREGGRGALFSHDPDAARPVTITCSSCGAQTPASVIDTVKGILRPGSFSIPFAKHGTRMRCPACGDSTWCRLGRHHSGS